MNPIDIRYWVKLHKRSQPIETDNLRNVKNDRMRNPDAMVIIESIYPTYHEFESKSSKNIVDGELSDAMRSDHVARMFNKSEQYNTQVMRKKSKSTKPKRCKCK